jgi:hypothetical protein
LRKLTKIEEEDRFAEDRSDEGSRLVEVGHLLEVGVEGWGPLVDVDRWRSPVGISRGKTWRWTWLLRLTIAASGAVY